MKIQATNHQKKNEVMLLPNKFILQVHDYLNDEYYSEIYNSPIERIVRALSLGKRDDWDFKVDEWLQLFQNGFLGYGYDTIRFITQPVPLIRIKRIGIDPDDKRFDIFENFDTGQKYRSTYSDFIKGHTLFLRDVKTDQPVYGQLARWMQIRRDGFDDNSRELFINADTGERYVDVDMDYSFHRGMNLCTINGTEPDLPVHTEFEIID